MGVCVSIVFEREIPNAEFDGDGKCLAACLHTLDRIARRNKLSPPLSHYFFDDQAAAALPVGQVLEVTWYDPQEGLRIASGIITALEAPDGQARNLIERGGILAPFWRALGVVLGVKIDMEGIWETLLADLKEMQRCLLVAAEQKTRFYLMYY